jgi:hypothetical protein
VLFAFLANTMSKKVWVTWSFSNGKPMHQTRVKGLYQGAIVDDLRDKFVEQQKMQDIAQGELEVSERKDGERLDPDKDLNGYFIPKSGSTSRPGQSSKTALVVTYQSPQQQDGE